MFIVLTKWFCLCQMFYWRYFFKRLLDVFVKSNWRNKSYNTYSIQIPGKSPDRSNNLRPMHNGRYPTPLSLKQSQVVTLLVTEVFPNKSSIFPKELKIKIKLDWRNFILSVILTLCCNIETNWGATLANDLLRKIAKQKHGFSKNNPAPKRTKTWSWKYTSQFFQSNFMKTVWIKLIWNSKIFKCSKMDRPKFQEVLLAPNIFYPKLKGIQPTLLKNFLQKSRPHADKYFII